MIMQQSYLKKKIEKIKRKSFKAKSRNILKSRKSKFQLLASILPISSKKEKKHDINEIIYFNYNKKAIISVIVSN